MGVGGDWQGAMEHKGPRDVVDADECQHLERGEGQGAQRDVVTEDAEHGLVLSGCRSPLARGGRSVIVLT